MVNESSNAPRSSKRSFADELERRAQDNRKMFIELCVKAPIYAFVVMGSIAMSYHWFSKSGILVTTLVWSVITVIGYYWKTGGKC